LITLIVVPVPFIRGIGIGGMLVPVISVLVTLTVLPALLAGIGRRLDWPKLRREATPARGWTAWARLVVRHRWAAAAAAVVILGALGVAALGMRIGDVSVNALSQQGQARDGVVLLEQAGIPAGVLTPIEAYVPQGTDPARVPAVTSRIPGVRGAVAPLGGTWRRSGSAVVEILTAAEGASPQGQTAAAAVRTALARSTPGVLVAGTAAGIIDQVHSLYGDFPLMLAVLGLVTFVLLARAFRSLVLPLKAVLANFVSVGAAYGVLVLVWQRGFGSEAIWGLPATGAITGWIPLFVFAFLYGLSMDYEVFLLARMREEYDLTGSTTEAVVTGVGRTGRLVTSAALILFLAMAALASAPLTFLRVFATGIGAGILLDATVVRSLLVPALVSLLGKWNWWMPTWAARILRVEPSPITHQTPPQLAEATASR
jgi:RND superfamily putative drug exporter